MSEDVPMYSTQSLLDFCPVCDSSKIGELQEEPSGFVGIHEGPITVAIVCGSCGITGPRGEHPKNLWNALPRRKWSPQRIARLEARQQNREMHPYTCMGLGSDEKCERVRGVGEGVLIPTPDGFVCPCGEYRKRKLLSFDEEGDG